MVNVRVKVCGITRTEDAEAAVAAGADAIGIVFYPPSPRNVDDLELARNIAMAAGPFVTVVGLFVNESCERVNEVLERVPLHQLQFHGDESAEYCSQFRRPYLKALRMKEGMDVNRTMAEYNSATGILLDTYRKGVPGGTGEAFNWQRVPDDSVKPIVLAGGLNPANVAEAIQVAQPYAVDVSGGVELEAGIKDAQKIRAFIKNAKLESYSEQ